ncbi:MAG: hypothetical protein LH478_06615 [Chitinophagaceae bacterium]|nr:hypothetical protein [Chitinophagaceae bacterium]
MNLDNLNDLPEWKDREVDDEDDMEAWKPNPTLDACKAMYGKWNEIVGMLNGALGSLKDLSDKDDDGSFTKEQKEMILGDAYETGVKIRSSEAGGIYIIRMENAAIIRKNAQYIKTAILGMMIEGEIEEDYGEIIRNEIDAFRDLFKTWIVILEKDEYTDEWGLFV